MKRPILAFWFFILLFPGLLSASCQNRELEWVRKQNQGRNASLDPFYRQLSHSAYWISIGYPVLTVTRAWVKKDSALWVQGLGEMAGSALTAGLVLGLKNTFRRNRPFEESSDIHPVTPLPDPWSFPSGHSSASFATATHMVIAWPKWYVAVPAYGWATWVAWARIRAGYHYPGDVLAGAVLGAGCAWAGQKATRWLQKKRKRGLPRPF